MPLCVQCSYFSTWCNGGNGRSAIRVMESPIFFLQTKKKGKNFADLAGSERWRKKIQSYIECNFCASCTSFGSCCCCCSSSSPPTLAAPPSSLHKIPLGNMREPFIFFIPGERAARSKHDNEMRAYRELQYVGERFFFFF